MTQNNALAETINGLYKTELIRPRKPWRTIDEVELATAEWVHWSTTAASTNIAATSHPSIWRLPITLNNRDQPPAEFSHYEVSGLTGAVHVQPGIRVERYSRPPLAI
jgi:putative transposase